MTMARIWAWLTAVWMWWTALSGGRGVQAAITCTAVTTTFDTTITCNFPTDIFVTKHNFNVQVYPQDMTSEDPDIALMCNWLRTGQIHCKTGLDMTFNNIISEHITLKGPPMLDRLGRKDRFLCQLVGNGNVPVTPCTLQYSDATTRAAIPTTTTTTASTKPTTESAWQRMILDKVHEANRLTVAIIFIFLIVIIVYIIVNRERLRSLIIWCVRLKRRKRTPELNEECAEKKKMFADKVPDKTASQRVPVGSTVTAELETETLLPREQQRTHFNCTSNHIGYTNTNLSNQIEEKDQMNKAMGNDPQIPGTMGSNLQMPGTMGNNSQILGTMGNNPQIPGTVGSNPQTHGAMENNPQISGAIGNNPQRPDATLNNPQIPRAKGDNPQITGATGYNPEIHKDARDTPEVREGKEERALTKEEMKKKEKLKKKTEEEEQKQKKRLEDEDKKRRKKEEKEEKKVKKNANKSF